MLHARICLVVGLAFLLFTAGCGSPTPKSAPPKVYKVTGKVLSKSGQPVAGGTVQFESLATPGQMAIAEVQPDGTFQIRTMHEGERLDGAVVGAQRVTYIPHSTDQTGPGPELLKQPLEVKPQDNLDLVLKL
ncbi:MAG TPA: hypothetical protein VL096_19190 [Pirellulaceae bacterium]|nr:hypothetical protein [Pirellulaceae bacterium]